MPTVQRRRRFLVASGAGLAALLAGCSDEAGDENGDDDNGDENGDENGTENGDENGDENADVSGRRLGEDDRVELIDHEWSGDGVTGTVENVSGAEIPGLTVEVHYHDDDDETDRLHKATDETGAMAAGDAWEFEAGFEGDADAVTQYKVVLDVGEV